MAIKTARCRDESFIREVKNRIRDFPQTDNGYLWSWGDSPCWHSGDEVCTVCGETVKQGEVIPATGDTAPDEPDDGDACPYCGKVHTGRHAKWITIVHLVFAFLPDVLRIIKK